MSSEAEKEFDKATQTNEYLSADISIELFTDIWVTMVETLMPSKTRSLSTLPFKWVGVCLSVSRSQTPPGGRDLEETCKARPWESLANRFLEASHDSADANQQRLKHFRWQKE